jgi:hypothetical protein
MVRRVLLLVLLAVAFQVLFSKYFVTWSVWIVLVQTGRLDLCFARNEWLASWFQKAENELDHSHVIPWKPLPELPLDQYSWERLLEFSDNWRRPVMVRGLFANISALEKWTPQYLAAMMKAGQVNVLRNNTIQYGFDRQCKDRKTIDGPYATLRPFNETMKRILEENSPESIILPPASRAGRASVQTGVDDPIEEMWDLLVTRDMDLGRLGGNFAAMREQGKKNIVVTQMFAGLGSKDMSLGSDWHCDICNNFIVQVSGRKRWYFVPSKDSIYMRPVMTTGKTAIAAGSRGIDDHTIPFLTEKYAVDINPGDFMYNPEWYWHKVENYEGYGMGIVSRECHAFRNFRQNSIFSSMILMNHLKEAITGDPEARKRILGMFLGFTPDMPVIQGQPGAAKTVSA